MIQMIDNLSDFSDRTDIKIIDIEIRPYMYNTMSDDIKSPKRHLFLRFESWGQPSGLCRFAETDTVEEAEQLKAFLLGVIKIWKKQ
jgi:hypothetical protein